MPSRHVSFVTKNKLKNISVPEHGKQRTHSEERAFNANRNPGAHGGVHRVTYGSHDNNFLPSLQNGLLDEMARRHAMRATPRSCKASSANVLPAPAEPAWNRCGKNCATIKCCARLGKQLPNSDKDAQVSPRQVQEKTQTR